MGLDTTHGCWHGPYSAFSRWRNEVAKAAGYTIRQPSMKGEDFYEEVEIDWPIFRNENFTGKWGRGPKVDDPLLYLIVHSDCDGIIRPEQGKLLADRLEELLPKMPGDGPWSTRERARLFVTGLREAAEAGEDVEFH